ncbi:MAG: sulfite exporter TauE/SafE family protein, partial [Gemmatimonadales bacterium]
MLPPHLFPLLVAGLVAGVMNAAAGGGSFVSLPALVFAGVPSIAANATSTVALVPGTFASAWAYRHDAKPFGNVSMRVLFAVMLAGGFAGAMLLLHTPSRTFDRIIPWLLLFGSLVFTFGPRLNAWLRGLVHIGPRTMVVGQFFLGTYAGYFGGAVGIMMLAAWSLLGVTDIKAMNAARMGLVAAANSVAVV